MLQSRQTDAADDLSELSVLSNLPVGSAAPDNAEPRDKAAFAIVICSAIVSTIIVLPFYYLGSGGVSAITI